MKAIEVGIGTGQATRPFLLTGCDVTAIELGADLTAFTREKYSEYKNFRVLNTAYEAFEAKEDSIDLIYSATAFHWIPENISYTKALKLLKPQGTLAVFWNKPFAAREDDALHREIQSIYNKYRLSSNKPIEKDTQRYKKIAETIRLYGFTDVETKLYHQTRTFTANEYIALLNTYSDHRSMQKEIKEEFEKAIHSAILNHGNRLYIYDTIDLYLARK